jgi:hypothetical protein
VDSLLDISKTFTANPGGMKEINMSLVDDIISIPLVYGNVMNKGFKMKAGKSFHRFYFTPDSCVFKEGFAKTDHGKEFTYTISFFYPGPTAEVIKQLEDMTRDRFIIVAKDNNNNYRVLGSADSPARFTYDHTTDVAIINLNRAQCTFTAKSNRTALYYTSNFDSVVYSAGYNFGFLRTT